MGVKGVYDESMCDVVRALAGEGFTRLEVMAKLGISNKTWHVWVTGKPEFKQAVEEAKDLAQAWWMNQGRSGIWAGKQFNAAAYRFQMMNRFGWNEKTEMDASVKTPPAPVIKFGHGTDNPAET